MLSVAFLRPRIVESGKGICRGEQNEEKLGVSFAKRGSKTPENREGGALVLGEARFTVK